MTSYNYYDPNQAKAQAAARRDQAMQRLMMLMDTRNKKMKQDELNLQREMEQAEANAQQSAWDNMGSMFGTAAGGALTGAAIGTAFAPGVGTGIGAAVGGGAGLLLGGLAESNNRKNFQQMQGNKDYGWGDAVGDSVLRAPNLNEVTGILGAGANYGSMAAQNNSYRSATQNRVSNLSRGTSLSAGPAPSAGSIAVAPPPPATMGQSYVAASPLPPLQPPKLSPPRI
jgi:hypothetical protein